MKIEWAKPRCCHIQRLKMRYDFSEIKPAEPELPNSFEWVPWKKGLTEELGRVLWLGFRHDLDGLIFPTFRNSDACRRLAFQLANQSGFLPCATWLIRYRTLQESSFCGMIQSGSSITGESGRIHNITVLPFYRHRGLGRALVLKALLGFQKAGCSRVTLEGTAKNISAINIYRGAGFYVNGIKFITIFMN